MTKAQHKRMVEAARRVLQEPSVDPYRLEWARQVVNIDSAAQRIAAERLIVKAPQ